jgi:hypothetical protein
MQGYELNFYNLDLKLDIDTAGDVIMATGPELTGPDAYKAYTQVYLGADTESLPSHGPQDLALELFTSEKPLWDLIYNVSEKKLDTLHSYLDVQLKRGWIRLSKSPARASVVFIPEE